VEQPSEGVHSQVALDSQVRHWWICEEASYSLVSVAPHDDFDVLREQ